MFAIPSLAETVHTETAIFQMQRCMRALRYLPHDPGNRWDVDSPIWTGHLVQSSCQFRRPQQESIVFPSILDATANKTRYLTTQPQEVYRIFPQVRHTVRYTYVTMLEILQANK